MFLCWLREPTLGPPVVSFCDDSASVSGVASVDAEAPSDSGIVDAAEAGGSTICSAPCASLDALFSPDIPTMLPLSEANDADILKCFVFCSNNLFYG